MDPFTSFVPTDYVFLELKKDVQGVQIVNEYPATGIVKIRESKSNNGNVSTGTSNSRVHIRPSEPFIELLGGYLVGHGIRVSQDGKEPETYHITEQSNAHDYDTNTLMFVNATLERLDIAQWQEQSLPIK